MSSHQSSHRPTNNNLDLIAVLFISVALLVTSALAGVFIAYPLFAALSLFIAVLVRQGFALSALLRMGLRGARQSLPVVSVLLIIGMVTAVWMAAGTVPALVYYGTGLISPRFFILWAFLLTSVVSALLGTSFGTVATLGIALIVIARGSDVDIHPVAGAIISGAFWGDRCSPMSSSAHLVASVTGTSLYRNLRNMVMSGLWPFLISLGFYTVLSLFYPVQLSAPSITAELPNTFNLSPVVLLPAGALFLLAIARVNVKLAMIVSLGLGGAIAHFLQHYSVFQLLQFSLLGYQLDPASPLQAILLGGGLLPMAKATLVVLISTAFAGIFAGSHALSFVDSWLQGICTQRQLGQATVAIATITNLFGCTQTLGIIMTGQVMQPHYQRYYHHLPTSAGDEQLALALEDTAVVIAPLIPWNIAGLIPATVLSVGPGFIPYTAYLLLLPLFVTVRKHSWVDGRAIAPLPIRVSINKLKIVSRAEAILCRMRYLTTRYLK